MQLLLTGTASNLEGTWRLVVNNCSTQPLPALYINYMLLSKCTCRSWIHSPTEKNWPQPTSTTKQKKHTRLWSNQQEGPVLELSALPAGAPTSQTDKKDSVVWEPKHHVCQPERAQHFPPCAMSLWIAHLYMLDIERVNLEMVPWYPLLNVMEVSSEPSGPTCSFRLESTSSLATINLKQMGKLLHSLIQLSKPFDFRIPRLLFDFSCLWSSW